MKKKQISKIQRFEEKFERKSDEELRRIVEENKLVNEAVEAAFNLIQKRKQTN